MFPECFLNCPWMFTGRSLNAPWMFTKRLTRARTAPESIQQFSVSPVNVPWIFPECCMNVAWMFLWCSLAVPLMFPWCSLATMPEWHKLPPGQQAQVAVGRGAGLRQLTLKGAVQQREVVLHRDWPRDPLLGQSKERYIIDHTCIQFINYFLRSQPQVVRLYLHVLFSIYVIYVTLFIYELLCFQDRAS
jgi:hypothetical protein